MVEDLVAFADVQVPERVAGPGRDGAPVMLSISWAARTLLGRRGGRPVAAAPLTLPVNVSSPQLADLDADGHLDLVFSATPDARYALGGGKALFMARGRGDGSCEEERSLLDPLGKGDALSGSAEIVAADFDGDGRTDVAVGGVDGIRILPGWTEPRGVRHRLTLENDTHDQEPSDLPRCTRTRRGSRIVDGPHQAGLDVRGCAAAATGQMADDPCAA